LFFFLFGNIKIFIHNSFLCINIFTTQKTQFFNFLPEIFISLLPIKVGFSDFFWKYLLSYYQESTPWKNYCFLVPQEHNLIFLQFLNAFDFEILIASLLGYTILAGTRTRARNQHYFNHFVSTFTVFDYTFEASVYFFQILLARHQHKRSYSLLDMMNLRHIFLYIAHPI
jgi:hypothetical protein